MGLRTAEVGLAAWKTSKRRAERRHVRENIVASRGDEGAMINDEWRWRRVFKIEVSKVQWILLTRR